jgi:hypothetical protein
MSVAAVLFSAASPAADLVVRAADQAPEAEDVKAGWTALVVFLLLIAAVVVLAFSLVKQLRKAQTAKDAGVYGDEPETEAELEGESGAGSSADAEPENHSAP